MNVMEDFEIAEIDVASNEWLKGRTLAELNLPDEGILTLGIVRKDNTYIGIPRGQYEILESDRLIVYGRTERIETVSSRHDKLEGKRKHIESTKEHRNELAEQDREEEESRKRGGDRNSSQPG